MTRDEILRRLNDQNVLAEYDGDVEVYRYFEDRESPQLKPEDFATLGLPVPTDAYVDEQPQGGAQVCWLVFGDVKVYFREQHNKWY